MELTDRDTRILAALGADPRRAGPLAARLGVPQSALRERLAGLAENGLVYDLGDGRYQRTGSGRRVLGTTAGTHDERLDTTPAVEQVLASFDLGPDATEAVRSAFAFLRYWGRATTDEIVDAVYSERPAGYGTADAWWTGCVCDPLAALPGVDPPVHDGDDWRYAGQPEVSAPLSDGFRPFARHGHPPYGSVKHAVESLDLSPTEREAVRAAFSTLRRAGEASEAEIAAAVYPDHPAGYGSAGAWWDGFLRAAFLALPGVRRVHGSVWRYVQSTGRAPRRRRRPEPDPRARGQPRGVPDARPRARRVQPRR